MSNPEPIDQNIVQSTENLTTENVVHVVTEEKYVQSIESTVSDVTSEAPKHIVQVEEIVKETVQQTTDNVVPEVVSAPAEQINREVPVSAAAAVETAAPPSPIPAPAGISAGKAIYESPNIKFEDDPTRYVRTRTESLIYWEHPKKSAIVFLSLLGSLILTQYYSVLQLGAGLFTIVTGLNLIYVNTHKQGQKYISGKTNETVIHPHSVRLQQKATFVSRDRIVHAAQLTLDVLETITLQITKLVLIEDNKGSAIALGLSYIVWTVAKYVSTKTLVGFFIITAFTMPRVYLQHQNVIDSHVAQHSQCAYALAQQYGQLANDKAQTLYGQAVRAIKNGATKKAD
ncbi:hypothetical protein DFQ28_003303 [Apophysomyces sp. BC1034]|nr:hypothetical protein DFQ30_007979 [Apophysomyces sp. BC1015]KAG0178100.1 hypothetical protein DFQ29_003945 [Apophysomyces sp. BC1021]KAG0189525.1 hypothetical protein DFQ28_003303 [Apophysomyces sp. BC1034]